MEFVNQFVVPAPVEQAWSLLADLPRIAPCLPGATVRQLEDGQFEGKVAVKVGPIKVSYRGVAAFTELNEHNRIMVLDARGKEASGKGSAAAVVHVDLTEARPGSTRVQVITDLQVTGKVAQFGRSAMADVGERIIEQFTMNLESLLTSDSGSRMPQAPAARRSSLAVAQAPVSARAEAPGAVDTGANADAEFNALSLAGPLLKRAAPAAAALVVGILIGRALGAPACTL
jgi:carbon monoxide dehydrogenase subunit G